MINDFYAYFSPSKEMSDQIRYSADEQSSMIFTIIHRYYVTNEGPSMVPKTYVNITIPVAMQEIVYAELKVCNCRLSRALPRKFEAITIYPNSQPVTFP